MSAVGGREFYDRHIRFLLDRDVDGLVASNYNEDAVLVTHTAIARGREELARFFRGYLEVLGELEVLSTDKFTDTGDTILFEATMRSALGEARVYDAFVLREGKIDYHFAGVM
jgi:ketosteroid isomerase-like protein